MWPASITYTRQAPLEEWLRTFQHQLSDGGRHARPAVAGAVAILREVRALARGVEAGHGAPKKNNVSTLQEDLRVSQAVVGPELSRTTTTAVQKLLASSTSLPGLSPGGSDLQELIDLVGEALASFATPDSLVAGFDDAADAYRKHLPLDLCEQRMRVFAQQVALAGHSYAQVASTLAAAINDDASTLARLCADVNEPTSLDDRAAGCTVDQRLDACRERLRRSPLSGPVIAWLIYEHALLPQQYLQLGPLEFFSGRDYPTSLREGWWRPEGPPEELQDQWSELFLPEALPDRECVLVRVALGPIPDPVTSAISLARRAQQMAYGQSKWLLMEGVALVRDGQWFGSMPHSTLDSFDPRGVSVFNDPTATALETLDAGVLEALARSDERALDIAADHEWLANVGELSDPAHRVALTVRLLERRLQATGNDHWDKATEASLSDCWADDQILQGVVDAAQVGIGALPDRWDERPQLTLSFRSLMIPPASGNRFHIRSSEIINHAKELATHLPAGSFQRQQVEEIVARTQTASAAVAWLRELKSDFRLLIGRANRQRNAILHGNDTVPEVLQTVDPFLRRLASILGAEHLGALIAGRTLSEQLSGLRQVAQVRDQRLTAGETPSEVLLQ